MMNNKFHFKVGVRCDTYNQAHRILDTLGGFSMQQTDFPFVCCIMDDCSTDNEQQVLREYMQTQCDLTSQPDYGVHNTSYGEVLYGPHLQNPNCFLAVVLLAENHLQKGKPRYPYFDEWMGAPDYMCMCEGDDYWIAPDKLQRQADWMDAHPGCMLCFSDAQVLTNDGELDWHRFDTDTLVPPEAMIENKGNYMITCTLMMRFRIEQMRRNTPCTLQCHVCDYCWQILSAIEGEVYYFADKMAAYRYKMDESSWNSQFAKDKKTNRFKMIKGAASEVNMLLGLDKMSQGRYHDLFIDRAINYSMPFVFCPEYTTRQCREARKVFAPIIRYYESPQRIEIFARAYGLRFVLKLVRRVKKLIGVE
ncbi:MAG: hypothetical protein KBT28_04390 [Bacteroidales bacterium]|nr:hypothetical protein [Candidatus Colimorpha merdihippi]